MNLSEFFYKITDNFHYWIVQEKFINMLKRHNFKFHIIKNDISIYLKEDDNIYIFFSNFQTIRLVGYKNNIYYDSINILEIIEILEFKDNPNVILEELIYEFT